MPFVTVRRHPFRVAFSTTIALIAAMVFATGADALEPATGTVVLTVDGALTHSNTPDGKAEFDVALLESVGTRELETETRWTDGARKFTGVPLAALPRAPSGS